MRHACRGRKLNRSPSHRQAMCRNMAQSLFEHGEIRTTLAKAREVRPFAEKLITLAIDGSLAARQRAIALLNDRSIVRRENQGDYDRMTDAKRAQVLRARSGRRYRASTTRPGVSFTAESVVNKLFAEIGPAMKKRNEARDSSGGYTRIIKLSDRRLGDGAPTAVLQLVGEDDATRKQGSDKTERKRRAKVKYLFYAGKPLPRQQQRRGASGGKGRPRQPEPPETATAAAEPPAEEPPAEETVEPPAGAPAKSKTPKKKPKKAEK